MDNFDNHKLQQSRISAPDGLYTQVRERIIKERMRRTKMRQQLVVGSALLLIIGVVNVSLIVFSNREKPQTIKTNTEQVLYETYFDNQILWENEK